MTELNIINNINKEKKEEHLRLKALINILTFEFKNASNDCSTDEHSECWFQEGSVDSANVHRWPWCIGVEDAAAVATQESQEEQTPVQKTVRKCLKSSENYYLR